MRLYAESSAIVAWLFGEARGVAVRSALAEARRVVASDLTLIECDRVLIRSVATGIVAEGDASDRRSVLRAASVRWHVLRIADDVVERSRRPFPSEPVRSLDAIHLASALVARSALPGLRMLSIDDRVRENAKALGFDLVPA